MTEPTGAQRDDLVAQFCAVTGAGPQQVRPMIFGARGLQGGH